MPILFSPYFVNCQHKAITGIVGILHNISLDEILKVNDVVAQILSEYIKRIKGASENGEMYGLVRGM